MNIAKPYKYPRFFIATARVVMVIHMASEVGVIQHAVWMLPIATSEVHAGLTGRRQYKFRITVGVSYISYKHAFIKAQINLPQA